MRFAPPHSLLLGFAILACVAHPFPGYSQPPGEGNTPEASASRALTALKEDRIADFAQDMHPEALASMKATLLEVVDAADKKGRVAEVLSIFKDVKDAGELRELDDVRFFTAFFAGMLKLQPRIRDTLRGMTLEVVGHVPEGDDVVHVVYRGTATVGNVKISKMSVMSLKADGETWRMLLTGDIEGMAAMMKLQFGARD